MTFSSVRDIYFDTIYDLIRQGEDIVIVSADLAAPSLDKLRKDFGNRFVSVGIAEQNLISVACGIALTGKRTIAYGLNPFPITRAFDQIRNTVSSLNIPITIAALNAGLCSAESGASHLSIEDINIVRTLPRIKVINVSDQIVAKLAANNTVYGNQPSFVRFDKQINYSIYENSIIDINKGFTVTESGKDIAIISSGYHLGLLYNHIKEFKNKGINITLIDCFALPVDKEKLANILRDIKTIVTVEENCMNGGIGSMILEILADNEILKPVKRFGINCENGYPVNFGNREYFMEEQGLNIDNIIQETLLFYDKFINQNYGRKGR